MSSEMTLLKEQIERECNAICSGLSGLRSGTARHIFIHAHMQNIERYHRRLCVLVGETSADDVLYSLHERSLRVGCIKE